MPCMEGALSIHAFAFHEGVVVRRAQLLTCQESFLMEWWDINQKRKAVLTGVCPIELSALGCYLPTLQTVYLAWFTRLFEVGEWVNGPHVKPAPLLAELVLEAGRGIMLVPAIPLACCG